MFRAFIGISSVISRREIFRKVNTRLREHLKTLSTVYPWSHPKPLSRHFPTGVSLLQTGSSDYVLAFSKMTQGRWPHEENLAVKCVSWLVNLWDKDQPRRPWINCLHIKPQQHSGHQVPPSFPGWWHCLVKRLGTGGGNTGYSSTRKASLDVPSLSALCISSSG